MSNNWQLFAAATVAAAAILRFYDLALKPLHHDEGVNGFFLFGLFREGVYRYDAANYHGPTLYYFALVTSSINNLLFGAEGPSTIAIRSVTALFGIGCIGLVLCLRRRLGGIGTFTAAALLAVSPGAVYWSRDFIHETLLVFFTLWLMVCVLWFWDSGRPRYLMLGSIAAALMFSTKETALISVVALVASAIFTLVWSPASIKTSAQYWGGWRRIALLSLGATVLFVLACILFFSSFFGNPHGIGDALTTFSYWIKTGISQRSAPWYTYLGWLWREETPLLILGAIGTVAALVKRSRFPVFAGTWALSLLVAYSILPYKTPWILFNVTLPMCIVAGYSAQVLWERATVRPGSGWTRRIPAIGLIAAALPMCAYRSIWLSFYHYDDVSSAYAYVQTSRGFLDLVSRIEKIAESSGTGVTTHMTVVTSEYWPLPWYLRDYKNVGYFGRIVPTESPIVIGSKNQEAELRAVLPMRYELAGSYPLRPGVELVLFLASDQKH